MATLTMPVTARWTAPADGARALDDAIVTARETGRRVGVCVVAVQGLSGRGRAADVDRTAITTAIQRVLRRGDVATCVGPESILVVAGALAHPADAVALSEKLAAALAPSSGTGATAAPPTAVGLAIYPNHGEDAASLIAAAEASAARVRQAAALRDDDSVGWGDVRRARVA